MIVVKMLGGLGNQLFQIAFAKALSIELNEDLVLDTSVYSRYKIRDFTLHHLRVSENVKYINEYDLNIFFKFFLKFTQVLYHIYQKIKINLNPDYKIGETSFKFLAKFGLFYNFDSYYYDTPKCTNKIKCVYGYFQSEKYFEKYKHLIKDELTVKTPLNNMESKLIHKISETNSVALSLRLGDDYTNSKALNVCQPDYYYNAMEYICNELIEPVFYVFSDRLDIVKENYNFKHPVIYVEGFSDFQSLRLMYNCKHFIISNSSFSWWGAYLSKNNGKIIIAPNKWNNFVQDSGDIYFKEMKLIKV